MFALFYSLISIHAPREGERHQSARRSVRQRRISIHAPREGERLLCQQPAQSQRPNFNPRSPRGGATGTDNTRATTGNFNPRSPRGGATARLRKIIMLPLKFQSTLPARGSDRGMPLAKAAGKISIHAPREGERPWVRIPGRKWPSDFNPRSPRGGATAEDI